MGGKHAHCPSATRRPTPGRIGIRSVPSAGPVPASSGAVQGGISGNAREPGNLESWDRRCTRRQVSRFPDRQLPYACGSFFKPLRRKDDRNIDARAVTLANGKGHMTSSCTNAIAAMRMRGGLRAWISGGVSARIGPPGSRNIRLDDARSRACVRPPGPHRAKKIARWREGPRA